MKVVEAESPTGCATRLQQASHLPSISLISAAGHSRLLRMMSGTYRLGVLLVLERGVFGTSRKEMFERCIQMSQGLLKRDRRDMGSGLSLQIAQQGSGNHNALDLIGPFKDLRDFHITHIAFYRVVPHIASAAQYLHGIGRHLHCYIGSETLCHGG